MKGHSCSVTALAATVSGGPFLFSGGEDGSLRMWSLAEGGAQVLRKIHQPRKNAKKGTKTKETAVTPSGQQPKQDTKKKRKQSLLPVQKDGSHYCTAQSSCTGLRRTRNSFALQRKLHPEEGLQKRYTPRTPSVATPGKKDHAAMSLVLEAARSQEVRKSSTFKADHTHVQAGTFFPVCQKPP
ncbi:hypothetical protein TcBrA4_0048740 [Trypanosoma cruzi]|nr:hypothetical protein TcBrA4_0048740 [Trypanosoma cruzi]